jgi:hypothetical protein
MLGHLDGRAPALRTAIDAAQRALGVTLPADYVEFLLHCDGIEGPVGDTGYFELWSIEEVTVSQQEYGVDAFAPGLVLIGSDGGGTAYGLDVRSASTLFVRIPFIPMAWEEGAVLGDSFHSFIQRVASA